MVKMSGIGTLNCIFLLIALRVEGQTTTASQNGCSYTFLVPKQEDNSCPVGSVASGSNDERIETLMSVIKNQQDQLSLLTQSVLQLQEEITLQKNKEEMSSGNKSEGRIGINYVRWGRTSCPDSASLIYEGYSAKSWYANSGGGANYICLEKTPEWPDGGTSGLQGGDRLHGVEYKTLTGLDSSLKDNNAPCAVCEVEGRGQQLMIPGRRTCPDSWTKEYEGLLVSSDISHIKATYVCLDEQPEVVTGEGARTEGGYFYTVEARCHSLPCPPFVDGNEVACVVCTR